MYIIVSYQDLLNKPDEKDNYGCYKCQFCFKENKRSEMVYIQSAESFYTSKKNIWGYTNEFCNETCLNLWILSLNEE